MNIKKELPGVKKNISLKNYTTFRIGGFAKYFFVAKNKEEIIKAVLVAKKLNPVRDKSLNGVKLPFFILGGGSNTLISDRGFKGLVIKLQIVNWRLKNEKIFCEAGVPLAKLVQISIKNNLIGLEWAIGIPGTLGGAIYGNAGAFGKSMGDLVKEVEVFDIQNNKIKIFKKRNCNFGYRESIFKKNKNLIILSAQIKLKKGKKAEIQKKIKEYLNHRRETQPLNFPSAGSIFKNPPSLFTGELVEKCGLKGKKIGKAKISEKHSNFILNLGGAKAKDVKKLIKLIKEKVKKKFGIVLEEEIQYLDC